MLTFLQWLRLVDLHARMAMRADSKTFVLGHLWWVLEPIILVAIFYIVFAVLLDSPRQDFLIFLIVGKIPFQWFSGAVNHSANSIVAGSALISQIPMQKLFFPLSKVQEDTYKHLAVMCLLLVYVHFFEQGASVAWLWLLPLMLTQYFLTVAVAVAAATAVCLVRDAAKLVQLGTLALMFGSGMFWDIRSLDPYLQNLVLLWNPIAYLLDAYRQVLLYGGDFRGSYLLFIFTFSVLVTIIFGLLLGRFSSELTRRILA